MYYLKEPSSVIQNKISLKGKGDTGLYGAFSRKSNNKDDTGFSTIDCHPKTEIVCISRHSPKRHFELSEFTILSAGLEQVTIFASTFGVSWMTYLI